MISEGGVVSEGGGGAWSVEAVVFQEVWPIIGCFMYLLEGVDFNTVVVY